MKNQKITQMSFAKVYPLYIAKAERKNRTKEEVDQIITWLTGYDQETLQSSAKTDHWCHLWDSGRRDRRANGSRNSLSR